MVNNNKLIIIFLLILLAVFSFEFGVAFTKETLQQQNNKPPVYLGCWKQIAGLERSIIIRTDNMTIKEIISVMKHELCHEVYFRIVKDESNFSSQASESFADTCNPNQYFYLDNGDKKDN